MNQHVCLQVSREQEQQVELDKLKREMELKRAEALSAQSALQSKEAVGISLHHTLYVVYCSLHYHRFVCVLVRRSAKQCVGGASG